MRRSSAIVSLVLAGSIAAVPLLVGCDTGPGDKVTNKSEKTTTDSNGNSSTTEQKTVQHPDGSVSNEKHTDSQHNNP